MSFSFHITTLGCKVNQYESHALREAWLRRGLREAADPAQAEVLFINSCAVTARAVADLRAAVRRLHRAAPEARIILTGCAAEVLHKELSDLPGVAAVMGQSGKGALLSVSSLPDIVSLAEKGGESVAYPPFALSGYDRSRALLKIQDGCSHGCAYCIVPQARGKARSRPFNEALQEAQRLLHNGFREIVISGVNLRQFTLHAEPPGDFWDFLLRLDAALAPEWRGRARLRLSSLEPGQLHAKALDALAASALVTPHLHLSLQSGSPSVLRRMGRGHYDPAGLPDFFSGLRTIWPIFGLGADILTGFPGETEDEFAQGLELCAALPLSYAHVFPYSRRPGTRAASMPDQVAAQVKKERAARLRSMVNEKKDAFLRSLLQAPRLHVVFEERKGQGPARGLCEYYADCRMSVAAEVAPRLLVPVRPLAVAKGLLLVETEQTGREARPKER